MNDITEWAYMGKFVKKAHSVTTNSLKIIEK